MALTHSICAMALAAVTAPAAAAQQPLATPTTFAVLLRSAQLGTEQVTVTRGTEGWTIASSGRIGPPLDLVIRNFRIRYDPDWKPLELTLDATARGQALGLHIIVSGTTATTHLNNGGQSVDRTDPITADTVFWPNPFFAAFEAITPRLKTAAPGSMMPVYQGGPTPVMLRIGESETERIQTVSRLIDARVTHAAFVPASGPELSVDVWSDEDGRLLRVSVPLQGLEYVRDDVGAVSTRRVVISRAGDEAVQIPANGFNLAGTVSKPGGAGAPRRPAIVLVVGSGQLDRDAAVAGIPIFGQLAGALADAGFVVLRYDKRGVGQSGGRSEAAGLAEYAEDARAAVKYMSDRKDVDPKRIAVAGHSEGGAAVLIGAAKDNRMTFVVLMGAPGHPGTDVVTAQQKRALARSSLSDADKQIRIDLQKRIHDAVLTGKGWETLPADLRRQIDNPEFQSILTFDPAKVIPQVRQPILILQGALDTQIDPSNADRLESLARARKRQAPVQRVVIPGVNHLFVPAVTGDVEEYATLKDKQISPAVAATLAEWLKTAPPR